MNIGIGIGIIVGSALSWIFFTIWIWRSKRYTVTTDEHKMSYVDLDPIRLRKKVVNGPPVEAILDYDLKGNLVGIELFSDLAAPDPYDSLGQVLNEEIENLEKVDWGDYDWDDDDHKDYDWDNGDVLDHDGGDL
jgi:hypothetical protein